MRAGGNERRRIPWFGQAPLLHGVPLLALLQFRPPRHQCPGPSWNRRGVKAIAGQVFPGAALIESPLGVFFGGPDDGKPVVLQPDWPRPDVIGHRDWPGGDGYVWNYHVGRFEWKTNAMRGGQP